MQTWSMVDDGDLVMIKVTMVTSIVPPKDQSAARDSVLPGLHYNNSSILNNTMGLSNHIRE